MTLSELIDAYGDDKVQAQYLDQCATSLNMQGKVTKITFGTEQRLDRNGTVQLGIVVWMDRDRVKAIVEAARDGR